MRHLYHYLKHCLGYHVINFLVGIEDYHHGVGPIIYNYGDIMSINIPYQRNVNADINASVNEELIDIRDSFRSCDLLSIDEVCDLLVNICVT